MATRKRNKLRTAWWNMIRRCTDANCSNYARYGGRGITVCDEWLHSFEAFQDWALANGYRDDLTIDRIDPDGNYEPSNCRWQTPKQQANNRRSNRICTYKGVTGTMAELCDHFGMDYMLVNNRVQKGWSIEDALSTPKGAPTKRRNNLITFNGITKTVSEWNKEIGGSKNTLSERLRQGYSIERALTEPVRKRRK